MNSAPPSLLPSVASPVRVSPAPASFQRRKKRLALLCLASLGIVYGDIGTSPLYAMRECFYGQHGVSPNHANVLGVLSLILWSLILIISVKYLTLILRADNRGEGGILVLATLVSDVLRRGKFLFLLGLFGAALLYADGMITPAISVMRFRCCSPSRASSSTPRCEMESAMRTFGGVIFLALQLTSF